MENLEKAKNQFHDHIYQGYIKYSERYANMTNEIENKIDKMMMTIAGGAILITVTLYGIILENTITTDFMWILKFSRITFIGVIVFTILGNRFSIIALSGMQNKIRKGYEDAFDKLEKNESPIFPDMSDKLSIRIAIFNRISFGLIVLGIIFIAVFGYKSF